ncbi:MAG: 3-phosphoshikimate 1-carboxyvinyltransferase [Solirubrobacterales bacterium]|nr:3-phosphoshikimate 1-carboxyvinyltransferase [Solirubrobacterales bacterium]
MSVARFGPGPALRGALRPPPDKSISHRAAIVAAMGEGEVAISSYLDAADTRSTLAAVEALGAGVEERGRSDGGVDLRIQGIGLRGPGAKAPGGTLDLDVGNAGTLLRLLPGWLAGQPDGAWRLDGDDSIRRRPVDRVAEPLGAMGASVSCRDGRLPPLTVNAAPLHGAAHHLPVASAQVKSCLLFAGLLADGETEIVEPAPSRNHTELMLRAAGAAISVEDLRTLPGLGGPPERRLRVAPVETLALEAVDVPGDFSSAAFFAVAAALVAGSDIRLERTGINPTRVGLLGILTRMGAPIWVEDEAHAPGGEPVGTIRVRHGPLEATRVDAAEVPITIDELPLVALLGCFAEGSTVVAGAQELRHKESDRIATVVAGLAGLGADIEAREDGFAVRGTGGLRGGALESHGDHRLAMLGAVAGLASADGVQVSGMEAAAVSYPGFEGDLAGLTS